MIHGGADAPGLQAVAEFYSDREGTWVAIRARGLPRDGFFAMHIHEGGSCAGAGFPESKGHFNPTNDLHPYHAGDLPQLLSSGGQAKMMVWTGRFRVKDILGRTVIIHSGTGDFHTQPSGNPGEKLACGVITAVKSRR